MSSSKSTPQGWLQQLFTIHARLCSIERGLIEILGVSDESDELEANEKDHDNTLATRIDNLLARILYRADIVDAQVQILQSVIDNEEVDHDSK